MQGASQAPQFLGSFVVSVQVPSQSLSPPVQDEPHIPPEHTRPPAHVFPHIPQFALSVWGSVHLLSQVVSPRAQPIVHTPAEHVVLPVQELAHFPQFASSVSVSTQEPEHSMDPAAVQPPPLSPPPPPPLSTSPKDPVLFAHATGRAIRHDARATRARSGFMVRPLTRPFYRSRALLGMPPCPSFLARGAPRRG